MILHPHISGAIIATLVAMAFTLAARAVDKPAAPALVLDQTEIAKLVRHGPWPPPLVGDISNRVSGKPSAIALGRSLFFDRRLSRTGKISCASCHLQEHGWSDGKPLGQSHIAKQERNTQSLVDVRFNRWFGWGGQADNLWAQSIRPILMPTEMGSTAAATIDLLKNDRSLLEQYTTTFGAPPDTTEGQLALANVGKALAAFQETLVSPRTSFDDFRDALASQNWRAAGRYPAAAQRGAKLFVGRGRCSVCHVGPRFTSGEFHDAGVPYFIAPGRVDPGRFKGIAAVKNNPFNLAGRYNDDAKLSGAWATRQVTRLHRNFGEFRIPTLRNLTATAPYMHNGSLPSLKQVVRHYSEINIERLHADGERILRPLQLTQSEISDLVAFLKTLSAAR